MRERRIYQELQYSVDNETGAEPFSIARFTRSMHWIVRSPTTLVHIFNHATGNGSHVHVVGVLKTSSDRPSQLEEAGRFITNMAIGTRSLKPAARWHAIFFPASGIGNNDGTTVPVATDVVLNSCTLAL
jgi:hypothetical protein